MMRALRFNAAFAAWPAAALDQLASTATLRSYRAGSRIADKPGERLGILVIVSGFLLASRRTPDGALHPVSLIGSGRIVTSECDLVWTPLLDLTYSAHDDAKVIHLNHAPLFSQLNAAPGLWKSVLAAGMHQRREFVETLLSQTIGSAPQRVARVIVRYAELYGVCTREPHGMRVPIRLSQSDLGALLQVSRQTIGETIKSFRNAGWISLSRAAITVLDPRALQEFAHGGQSCLALPMPAVRPLQQ